VALKSILLKELEKVDWLTMEQYMDLALYHPEKGYYMNKNQKIGKNGDFYTSSSISDVFGRVWADFFSKTIHENNLDPIIVEFGGGNGRFAKQVHMEWKDKSISHIRYIIVETSPFHRQLLKNELQGMPVTILSSLEELKSAFPAFKGIIFANEVLDAFGLRIFKNRAGTWYEKGVSTDRVTQELSFSYKKVEDTSLYPIVDEIYRNRNKEHELEVSLQMLHWLKAIYQWAEKSTLFFFIDYGYTGSEWNSSFLHEGSIRGYRQHKLENHPLAYPGEMDITYHVDWDQVESTAMKAGVETVCFSTQGEFLIKAGLLSLLQNTQNKDPFSIENKRNRAVRSFLLDSTLARGFQVMQQKKRAE
jgi:SAM-dependent MidA family methyltransferase